MKKSIVFIISNEIIIKAVPTRRKGCVRKIQLTYPYCTVVLISLCSFNQQAKKFVWADLTDKEKQIVNKALKAVASNTLP